MNREQFLKVAAEGDRLGFNRQIAPWVLGKLPTNGRFKVLALLVHEHIGGKRVAPHMRTAVGFRLPNGERGAAFIDMTMETFSGLSTQQRERAEETTPPCLAASSS
jgi:hypothetical protein